MISRETMIQLHHVSRWFGHIRAINDVDLTIYKGELFGIVGPDGSGKTTLLRMMAAVLDPSEAHPKPHTGWLAQRFHPPTQHIIIDGSDSVLQAETIKAHQGYMPQNFGLYGDLSVDENLAFAAEVFGLSGKARTERIDALLAFAALQHARSRPARLLSGGMKKKLALACAIIHRPQVLLLDEPTTGVDPVTRRDFWDLLSKLHAEQITVVVSTPYMDEAERCNRVAMLLQGRVLMCDTPTAIKAQVPGHVLVLRGADLRLAEAAVRGMPEVIESQSYGNQLNIIVGGDMGAAQRELRVRLEAANVRFTGLEPAPMRMEEAFIYLVNAARTAKGAIT
ncbi:MAG: ABC transporter ATP-binding protein [Aggregatilineales bacterium]